MGYKYPVLKGFSKLFIIVTFIRISKNIDCMWYLSSLSGLVFSKQFLLTLVVGVTFGFSFAYMLLGAAGAGRRELFQGPPYPVDTSDPHDHQVPLWLWKERYGDVYLVSSRRPK